LESKWIPEFLDRDFMGQNILVCRFIYIIGKLLNKNI
jgi:hypothetical protein